VGNFLTANQSIQCHVESSGKYNVKIYSMREITLHKRMIKSSYVRHSALCSDIADSEPT